ncbi:MAG: phosphoribosylglycinamide formyltransferase [Planctomycetes bacterium]|nr:phosphoribosylglycinamide formyltransferase [Planctomycetota bacterium]
MSGSLRLGILVSGGGRTMLNIADCIERGTLAATVRVVISSRAEAPAVHRARERGLDVRVAARSDFAGEDEMHDVITSWLLEGLVDLVCLAGYLRWFRVDPSFKNRVMNLHPALLPDFGGHGMYGATVHRAVLDSGATVSGCTVHFVDDRYDHGPIILQRTCPVLPGDDANHLAGRVFEQELIAYPHAIGLFATDRLSIRDGSVNILAETSYP